MIPVVSYLMYQLRSLPQKLWNIFLSQITITVTLDDSSKYGLHEITRNLLKYYTTSKWFNMSKSLRPVRRSEDKSEADYRVDLVPGSGFHFMIYKWRPLVLRIYEAESSKNKFETITTYSVTMLGRSRKLLDSLISSLIDPIPDSSQKIYMYTHDWVYSGLTNSSTIEELCISHDLRYKMESMIDEYLDRDWYTSRNLPHKSTLLLTGSPGTGKSTLIRSLSSTLNYPMYILDLSSIGSNSMLTRIVSSVPRNSILVLEDIDASSPEVRNRESRDYDKVQEAGSTFTLSGLLNCLDGIIPINDCIVVMTTNHPEVLDPALTRKSRVDHTIEVMEMTDREIRMFTKRNYHKDLPSDRTYDNVRQCDIAARFSEYRHDFDTFSDGLAHKLI